MAMLSEADQRTLEAFLLDNPELAQLEALLDEFNNFETIGTALQKLEMGKVT